jgi:hypothetical protein
VSVIVDIADALAEALNGHEFSVEFEAARDYRPVLELQDMKTLHVSVVPKGITMAPVDRARVQHDVEVDVLVQKKLDAGDADELDALMSLVEEIAGFLKFKRLESVGAMWVKTANEPVFAPDHLDQFRQFTSVLTVTYRVVR